MLPHIITVFILGVFSAISIAISLVFLHTIITFWRRRRLSYELKNKYNSTPKQIRWQLDYVVPYLWIVYKLGKEYKAK